MVRKQHAGLFFDQAGRHRVLDLGIEDIIGWYGNAAVEAMAFGIPTVAHLSQSACEQAAAAGADLSDNPVINIARDRRSMIDAFRDYAGGSFEHRAEISRKTRAYAESFHGNEACAKRLAAIYANLTARSTSDWLQAKAS